MPEKKANHVLRSLLSVTGVIAIAKVLGLVKQMVVASHFGATIETDVINLSINFIGNLQYALVQVLLTAFTSSYIHMREEDESLARRFTGETIHVFALIAVGLSALSGLAAPVVARILAPSYSAQASAKLAGCLRLFSPVFILYILQAVSQALLNSNDRFVPGEMIGLNQSVILIALVFVLEPYLGVNVLICGFIAYTVYNTLFLIFCARKYISFARGNPFSDPAVRTLLRMTGPLFLSHAMVYINDQVDQILASGLPTGTVTALGYASVLTNFIGTFIFSFCSILYTRVTSHISREEHGRAAESIVRSTSLLILAFLPISIIVVRSAQDIVTVVFGRGAYTPESVRVTASALVGYGFMFVPLVLREQFSRFQYGYQNSRMPMINSVISILLNIFLSIVFCSYWGVFGIAFASSISVLICGLLNIFTARRLNRALSLRPLLRRLPLMAAGGLACYLIAGWALRCFQAYPSFLRFVLVTLCAGAGYLAVVSPVLLRLIKDSGMLRRKENP